MTTRTRRSAAAVGARGAGHYAARLGLATSLLIGCQANPRPAAAPARASRGDRVQRLFAEFGCLMCHAGTDPEEGLSLSRAATAREDLVGKPSKQAPEMQLVVPGDPARSYLLHKLTGTQARVGGTGDRMPEQEQPLPEEKIALIRDWIEAGAP